MRFLSSFLTGTNLQFGCFESHHSQQQIAQVVTAPPKTKPDFTLITPSQKALQANTTARLFTIK